MYFQDFFPSFDIRSSHCYLTIKTSRTQNSRIQNIHAVGGRHNDNALVDAKAIHLHQQLVQCLFPLIVTAAHTGTPASCHCVNLINKYNTGLMLLGIFKQISDTRSAHAHKHLHKVGTRNAKERHSCLAGYCLGQ